MCKKIRIGSLTFVMIIMSLFFALPAMAADIFSVTVPTGIPVTLNADGSITTATNVEITNNSSKGVAISNLQLIPATNWKLVEFTDDFVNKKVNTKEFALQILGQGFKADGNFDESGLSAIGVGSKLVLNYAVKVTAQSSAFVSTLGNLVFTLDWIPPSPESWFVFDSATGSVTGLSATYKALKPLPTVIDIPATIGGVPVKAIGKTAFNGCSGLTSITIPNGVTSIGNGAFMYCSSLTSINIPDGVTSINNRMFDGCSSLTSITIPKGVISIGNSVFKDCSSLTSITIPDGVTSIGDMVFSGCTGLTSMSIPNSVTSIGTLAFDSCLGLTSITIPNSVNYIGNLAFQYCSSLTSITIDKVKDSITGSPWGAAASTTINWAGKMAAAPIMSMTVELLPIPPAIGESAGGIRPAQPPVNDSNLNPSPNPNPNQLAKPNQPPISDSNLNPNQVVKPAQPPMENNINNGTNKDVSITKDVQKKEVVVPNKPSEVDGEGKKI